MSGVPSSAGRWSGIPCGRHVRSRLASSPEGLLQQMQAHWCPATSKPPVLHGTRHRTLGLPLSPPRAAPSMPATQQPKLGIQHLKLGRDGEAPVRRRCLRLMQVPSRNAAMDANFRLVSLCRRLSDQDGVRIGRGFHLGCLESVSPCVRGWGARCRVCRRRTRTSRGRPSVRGTGGPGCSRRRRRADATGGPSRPACRRPR